MCSLFFYDRSLELFWIAYNVFVPTKKTILLIALLLIRIHSVESDHAKTIYMFNDICLTIAELHNDLDDLKNKTCKLG